MRFLRAAWVIARRDFVASVYSKSFLLFLLGPLVILGISVLFGSVTQNLAREDVRVTVAVVAGEEDFESLAAARERLVGALDAQLLPDLVHAEPQPDRDAQVKALLQSREKRVMAVMTGGIAEPRLTGPISQGGLLQAQIELMVADARRDMALAGAELEIAPAEIEVVRVDNSAGVLATTRAITARASQLVLFILTVLLAGMLLSNMVEERSNKVIEVLAAAVPVDGIFVGKVFAMLAVSLVGIAVWGAAALAAMALKAGWAAALPPPAVGWPFFFLLVLFYYSANYLLFGALFLGIGSQAASVREVQTLSMPVTIGQMLIFLFASVAVRRPDDMVGIAAAVFPFSSPLAMIARAAQSPEIWPHAAALLWQALWVWLTVWFGAKLFRRNVLKSGARGLSRLRARKG